MNSLKVKIIEFLKANGWDLDLDNWDSQEEFWAYQKDDCIVVEISDKEMVFIDGTGDFLHEKLNLYTLIGVLIYNRQLSFCFKQP